MNDPFDLIPTEKSEVARMLDKTEAVLPMPEVARLQEAELGGDYFSLGFDIFDSVMGGGVRAGDLVVISGITGHGKTTLAQTFGYQFHQIAIPQLWFSYEVDIPQLMKKFTAMGLDENFLAFTPLKVSTGSVDWLDIKIREAILKYNTQIVFVDHLGFLTPKISKDADMLAKGRLQENYAIYLGNIVRQLKTLAVERSLIIFLLAHVRKIKGKEEVDLEHIAHSAGIAQESDFVFMVERLRKKLKAEDLEQFEGGDIYSNESRIWLLKNRRTGATKFTKCELIDGKLKPQSKIYHGSEPPREEVINVEAEDRGEKS